VGLGWRQDDGGAWIVAHITDARRMVPDIKHDARGLAAAMQRHAEARDAPIDLSARWMLSRGPGVWQAAAEAYPA
jgi:hypothetical protein